MSVSFARNLFVHAAQGSADAANVRKAGCNGIVESRGRRLRTGALVAAFAVNLFADPLAAQGLPGVGQTSYLADSALALGSSSALPILIVAAGVFAGAFVAGFAGFGLAAAAGAFLLHVLPAADAIPLMMLCSIAVQVAGLIVMRKSVKIGASLVFILGGVLGVPLAIMLLGIADPGVMRLGFGAFLVLYAMQALLLPMVHASSPSEVLAAVPGNDRLRHQSYTSRAIIGFAGGFVGGLTAMPGAVLSVWADIRGGDKVTRRVIVQPFILAMQIFAILLLTFDGRLLRPELLDLVKIALPPLMAGAYLGLVMYGRVDTTGFRRAVLVLILVSGAAMIVGGFARPVV